MAEITNGIDWLKACNYLVLENYADADAWGWDSSGGIEPSDVELEAKQLWRLGRSEFYDYFNPIHRAIFGFLCWHMIQSHRLRKQFLHGQQRTTALINTGCSLKGCYWNTTGR